MDKRSDIAKAKDSLTQFIETHKMRKTIERYAVLETLHNAGRRVTVEELMVMMPEDVKVSRATIYNVIGVLIKAGLVIRCKFGKTTEYEYRSVGRRQFHKVCTYCGNVVEFTNDALSKFLDEMPVKGFDVCDTMITFSGICSKCKAKLKRAERKKQKHINKEL